MVKEKLLTELKTKLGTTGLTERTLSEYVDAILPGITSDEQVNDTFYSTHVGILKTLDGQLNKDVAERVNAAKGEWEKSHQDTPKQNPNPNPADKPNPLEDALKSLQTQMAEIQGELKASKEAETARSLKDQVVSAMRSKGADNNAVLLYTFKGEKIDTSKSVDELTQSYLESYNANYHVICGEGATPRSGNDSHSGSKDTFLDSFFEQKTNEGKMPKSE